jgi:multimeric flavodoxin WrbA
MRLAGIIASPRKSRGWCYEIVSRILSAAKRKGAETEIMFLMDEKPQYCIHCGHPCFSDGTCIQEEAATFRSQRIDRADAIVLAAPVYCWQPNALTGALFDKYRLQSGPWNRVMDNGRPALAIAVAGGTGTGVFNALQSMVSWMCLWKYRPFEPLPVTRFNYRRVLEDAPGIGERMAAAKAKPFREIWELIAAYDSLPYMDYGHADEFRWLSEQALTGLRGEGCGESVLRELETLSGKAMLAQKKSQRDRAAEYAVQAYQAASRLWLDFFEGKKKD